MLSNMSRENEAVYYGVEEGKDCTTALQLALEATAYLGVELVLPPFTMRISKPLVSKYSHTMIQGRGRHSVIKATEPGFTALTVGTGEQVNPYGNHRGGYLSDFTIEGAGKPIRDMTAGLRLDNARFVRVSGVESNGFNFGFDMIRNCFGSSFSDIRTHFGDNLVGIRQRGLKNGVWGSGSDIPIYNSWLAGVEAAVWVDPGGGGYNFFGGQMGMGYGLVEDREDLGCIVIGMDYEDGTIGGSGIVTLNGMDFEGWKRAYGIRAYGRCQIKATGISFIASDKEQQALGVLKITDGENGVCKLDSCAPKGTYSRTKLVEISTNGSAFTFNEENTLPDYNLYAAGVQVKAGTTLSQQSKLDLGIHTGRQGGKPFIGLGKTMLKTSSTGELQVSYDFGQTYHTIVTK